MNYKFSNIYLASVLLYLVDHVVGMKYVAYYTAWATYGRNYQVSDIPLNKISHINYAFANIAGGKLVLGDPYADIDKAFPGDSWDTAKQPYRGNFWQLLKIQKPKYPNLRVYISVGGWTWSKDFSTVAATEASRAVFIQSVVDFMTTYEFDGVDLDWEYPVAGGLESNIRSPDDAKNYVLLLKELRVALDKLPGQRRLLSIAAPAGPQIYKYLDIPGLARYLDNLNIMTYDYRGGWSTYTGHHAPLFPPSNDGSVPSDDPDAELGDSSGAVQYYIDNGMAPEQIILGVAFYGRGWQGVPSTNNGLYQKFSTIPRGTWDDGQSGSTGVYDYKDVKAKVASGGYTRYWDDVVKAPWAYSAGQQAMISYEDPQSVREKIAYVKSKGLGGIMIWELAGDDRAELSGVIYDNLFGNGGILPPSNDPPPSWDNGNDGGDDTTQTESQTQPNSPSSSTSSSSTVSSSSSSSSMSLCQDRNRELSQTGALAEVGLNSTSLLIGMAIGSGVTLLILGLVYFVCKRRTNQQQEAQKQQTNTKTVGKSSNTSTPTKPVIKASAPIKQPAKLNK